MRDRDRDAAPSEASRYGVLILAGGEATRLPGKLALLLDGVPLIVRVYRNFAGPVSREIVVSAKATFAPELDASLPVPVVIDRVARRGPLGGIVSALGTMRSRYVFVVAGDAPYVDAALADALASAMRGGDEAVVPIHDTDVVEPLAALYERAALARVGFESLRNDNASVRALGDRLRTRNVRCDARTFANANTDAELDAMRRRTEPPPP